MWMVNTSEFRYACLRVPNRSDVRRLAEMKESKNEVRVTYCVE